MRGPYVRIDNRKPRLPRRGLFISTGPWHLSMTGALCWSLWPGPTRNSQKPSRMPGRREQGYLPSNKKNWPKIKLSI